MDLFFSAPDSAVEPPASIPVGPMPQRAEVLNESEDWTGVTDAKERRKLQNRLNQRAKRRKQRQRIEDEVLQKADSRALQGDNNSGEADDSDALDELAVTLGQLELVSPEENAVAIQKRGKPKPYLIHINAMPDASKTYRSLSAKARESYLAYSLGKPTHGHLTTIVHFNVFHGLARNAALLGMQNEWLIKGATSRFVLPSTAPVEKLSCPANMVPTALQRTTPHHPWVDLWPLPRMRNNFLAASLQIRGTVDEDAMCRDIVDVGAGEGIDKAALVVWGDAWNPRNWEATEGFLRKWGWLLEGCEEIIEGTNMWRRRRGERPFRFNVRGSQEQV